MKTYQLKFLAWTFSAFLPSDNVGAAHVDYYELLDIPKDATGDEIKKAYRKRSLQLHPDKLRQRGMRYQGEVISEDEARARFQQMKSAYDTLSDSKKRQIYDALGHRGIDFVINPSHAYDPHVLLGNLAKSSVSDRAKLMGLIFLFFGLVLLQPILVCAKVDQTLGGQGGDLQNSSWVALMIPFWIFALFYGVLLIIGKAALPLLQWIPFVIAILFLALKFDEVLLWKYAIIFIPFYIWILLRFIEAKLEMRSVRAAMSKMVTIEFIEKFVINETKQDEDGNDIEHQLNRTYNDLNEDERDDINKEYIIVHVPPRAAAPGDDENDEEDDFDRISRSPEYQEASARYEYASKSIQRIVIPEIPLLVLIIVQLDLKKNWNWGLTFMPLWISMLFECCGGCYGFFCTSALAHIEVQEAMADHFAKEQEAKKNNEGEEAIDEVKEEANKFKGEEVARTDDTSNEEIAVKEENNLSEVGKTNQGAGIDTAISVEQVERLETKKSDEVVGEAKSETTDLKDDDEFMFEMDEDTFSFYQQAEQEAENKATEAQSKAIASFCIIIFQVVIASLFVVKLNQVYDEREREDMDGTSSFSTFWILFPFLLVSGCIISCFACAIFGAANIDSAMSPEEDSKNGDGDVQEDSKIGDEEVQEVAAAGSNVVITCPPPQQDAKGNSQKDKDESNEEVSNVVDKPLDNAPSSVGTAEVDLKGDMDDLD